MENRRDVGAHLKAVCGLSSQIAVILLVLLLLMLAAGCQNTGSGQTASESASASEQKTDKPAEDVASSDGEDASKAGEASYGSEDGEVPVGTLLDKPEKTAPDDIDKVAASFTFTTPDDDSTWSCKIAVDNTDDDNALLYVTDMLTDYVYVQDADGNITKYVRDVFDEAFTADTESSQDELSDETSPYMDMMLVLGFGFTDALSEASPNVQDKKCEDSLSFAEGETYAYDIMEDGEKSGRIVVDKESGCNVYFESGEMTIYISDLRFDDLGIPDYK